jgi:hypothetical protein
MEQKVVIAGRVAYDVENAEWVMFIEDTFVPMENLYKAINEQLIRDHAPLLRIGDEITVSIKRN